MSRDVLNVRVLGRDLRWGLPTQEVDHPRCPGVLGLHAGDVARAHDRHDSAQLLGEDST